MTASSPRGSLRASVRWGDCYGSFLHKPYRLCQSPSPGGEGGPAKPGRVRAGVEDSSAWGIDAPAQGGNGIPLPTVTTISPPHQSAPLTASPRGEAYATMVCWGYYYDIAIQALPKPSPGGKVGRPEAGSDEGVRRGFLGVGNRPTNPFPKGTHPRPCAPSRWARFGRRFNERATGRVIL